MKRLLVIAAHPDDEILGCGAIMAKYIATGHDVRVLIVAEGLTSRQNKRDREVIDRELSTLKETTLKANAVLGVKNVCFLNLPDNRLDGVELLDVTKKIEDNIEEYLPDIVITHHSHDLNIDHQIVSRAVLTAVRPMKQCTVKELYYFEIPSSSEWNFDGRQNDGFIPNVFVNVEPFFDAKIEALKVYNGEMREWPHPRSIKAISVLAGWRGAIAGYEKAESLMVGFVKKQ